MEMYMSTRHWTFRIILLGLLCCGLNAQASNPPNGGFETGLASWIVYSGNVTISFDAYSGSNAGQLEGTPDISSVNSSVFSVVGGETYELSSYVKQTAGTGNYTVTLAWLDSGSVVIVYDNVWAGNNQPAVYTFHGGSFVAPPDAVQCVIMLATSAGTTCLFDDIQLEIGVPPDNGPAPEIGITPSHVNGTPIDPLFSSYSQWASVAKRIDFFKYYGCMYSWCGPINTASMVSFMDQHDINITCEYGDFPYGTNAAGNFGIAEQQLDPIFAAGGQVTAVHLDGPIRRLLMSANPTVDINQAASEIVEFWGLCRTKYPNMKIGLLSNLPNWDYNAQLHGWMPNPNFTDSTGVYYEDALNIVYTALVNAGHTLDFFEIDCPYQYYITTRTADNDADVDNPAKFRSIQSWCQARGVNFHLVVNAEPRTGYQEFYTGTIAYINRLKQDQIFPDVITIQSWYTEPTANLPETILYTFMNTARDVIDIYFPYPGDLDTSGSVSFDDLLIMIDQWLQIGTSLEADINEWPDGDSKVNFFDFILLGKDWQKD